VPTQLETSARFLAEADAIVVAAGAGIGVDSGLPDFRGNEGFWKAYPALAKARMDFTRIANPAAFHHHPELAWGFYGHRLNLYRQTVPHAGFEILQRWGQEKSLGIGVFTSNVDGQFQKAGFGDNPIQECHGSIHHLQCLEPCCDDIWPADDFAPVIDEENCLLVNEPPHCPRCGGMARPNILMFGDWGWLSDRSAHQEKALDNWLWEAANPVVIELGAGTAIPSVRHFSQRVLRQFRGKLIRINLREWQTEGRDAAGLAASALKGLLELDDVLGSSAKVVG
jgi:NAD-dependent SIR2 family protein deacetylase